MGVVATGSSALSLSVPVKGSANGAASSFFEVGLEHRGRKRQSQPVSDQLAASRP